MPSLPECAICLDDLCGVDQWGQDKSISALGCGHTYHEACLAETLALRQRCPTCSKPTQPSDPAIRRVFISASNDSPSSSAGSAPLNRRGSAGSKDLVQLRGRMHDIEVERNQLEGDLEDALGQVTAIKKERDELKTSKRRLESQAAQMAIELNRERTVRVQTQRELQAQRSMPASRTKVATSTSSSKSKLQSRHTSAGARKRRKVSPLDADADTDTDDDDDDEGSDEDVEEDPAAARRSARAAKTKLAEGNADAEDDDEGDDDEDDEDDDLEMLDDPTISVEVKWSGRGTPSTILDLKPYHTFKDIAHLFYEATGGLMPQGGFRVDDKAKTVVSKTRKGKKTVKELLGRKVVDRVFFALQCERAEVIEL